MMQSTMRVFMDINFVLCKLFIRRDTSRPYR